MLKENNLELALGSLSHGATRIPLRSMGEFRSLSDIGQSGGDAYSFRVPDLLEPVGQNSYGAQEEEVMSRYQGEPRVMVSIQREYGAHIVEVSSALRAGLDRLQKILPYGLKTEIVYDQGEFILNAMHRLRDAGLLGGLFASLVVWVFLRHLASTLIIVLAIPLSVITSFGFMYLSGISLNLVSLAGLTLGIGMLVDNAIVVVENIYRYQKSGLSRRWRPPSAPMKSPRPLPPPPWCIWPSFSPSFFFQKKIRLFYQDLCLHRVSCHCSFRSWWR